MGVAAIFDRPRCPVVTENGRNQAAQQAATTANRGAMTGNRLSAAVGTRAADRYEWESPLRRVGLMRRLAPLITSGMVLSLLVQAPDLRTLPVWQGLVMAGALGFALSFSFESPPWCRIPTPPQVGLLLLCAVGLLLPVNLPANLLSQRLVSLISIIVVIPLVMAVPWERIPKQLHAVIPLLGVCAIYFDRIAAGSNNVSEVYYYLTTLALALYFPPRAVAIGCVLTVISALAPTGATLSGTDLTFAVLLVYMNIPIAIGIAVLGSHLRRQTGTLIDIADLIDTVAGTTDPAVVRNALCATALHASSADVALFFEQTLDHHLLLTGSHGIAIADVRLPLEATADDLGKLPLGTLGIVKAWESAVPVFLGSTRYHLVDGVAPGAGLVVRAALASPVVRNRTRLGVLALLWGGRMSSLPVGVSEAARILSQYAGLVVQQADFTAQLDTFASTDGLTGAYNRRAWDLELPLALGDAHRRHEGLTLVIIDVDNFKEYNDTHGHPAGDRLLQDLSRRWKATLRDGDYFARLGGDEFGALISTAGHAAATVVQRLRDAVPPAGCGCSIGATTLREGDTIETLLARADAVMYEVKREHHGDAPARSAR